MSGLYSSLNKVVGALNAQSKGIETAGRNLANVNNSSYARQRVIFGDRGTVKTPFGAESLGVEAQGVQQIRDSLLDQQVARELSLKNQYTTTQLGLKKAQSALGQSVASSSSTADSTNGIAECMSDFFGSFSSLSAKTTDVGVRQTLLQNSQILVDRFNLTDSRLAQVQSDMTTQIETDVSSVNDILASVASLNQQISRFEVNNEGGAVDLRDSRQAKLEELSKMISFETRTDAANPGQLEVYTKDSSGGEVMLVKMAESATITTDTGATTFTATNIPGAASGATATMDITSGSIKGAIDVRDTVQGVRDNIDMLARQLVTSVNDAYNVSGSGMDFFDVSAVGSASAVTAATIKINSSLTASNLEPNLATATATGDNSVATSIAALTTSTFATPSDYIDGTFNQHYVKTVSSLGQSLSGINSRLTDQTSIESLVRSQRDSVSGVSLDEEMADLMKFQRAFQANSKVFNTIDQLLNTIVNGLGNG